MANLTNSLAAVVQLLGAIGAAIVDLDSGISLGQAGGGTLNLDVAAAGNTEVVRAKMCTMGDLGLNDEIEDILITLTGQYHLIRMSGTTMFIYIVLDRAKSNLAMARKELEQLEKGLEIERR